MLVLKRGAGEEVVIGTGADAVTIRVLGFNKLRGVKLGIVADASIRIDRQEIALRRARGVPPLPKPRRDGRAAP